MPSKPGTSTGFFFKISITKLFNQIWDYIFAEVSAPPCGIKYKEWLIKTQCHGIRTVWDF